MKALVKDALSLRNPKIEGVGNVKASSSIYDILRMRIIPDQFWEFMTFQIQTIA
jgi:hypothetical protein